MPKALIAHTIKGKGVLVLEDQPLSHITTIDSETIDQILR